ncbi:MAG: M28 family peptidase [Bacilli bacterium]|nr:M28 family peptidase [Bacilli bacterium]
MKDYLTFLNEKYPIRRSKEQKEAFIKYVKEEVSGYNVEIEILEKEHNNIVIGDVENAKVVFTAHYDTPATSIVPNLMLPKNKVLGLIYAFSYPILLAFASLGIAYLIYWILKLPYFVFAVMYIILYLGSFYLLTRCFPNKNNYNDNTSGVATILTLIEQNKNDNIAFILFDNEEKGLLGSKAFQKKHKEIMKDKLVINLDCVGNGDHFIIIYKEKTVENSLFNCLKEHLNSNDLYSVEFINFKKALGNSDHKNFDLGIGVVATKKSKRGIYYTSRIHTNRDIEVSSDNIYFLSEEISKFIENI